MDPPDGSLAPLPGAEILFRVFVLRVNFVQVTQTEYILLTSLGAQSQHSQTTLQDSEGRK
jgi:hypothetical protein